MNPRHQHPLAVWRWGRIHGMNCLVSLLESPSNPVQPRPSCHCPSPGQTNSIPSQSLIQDVSWGKAVNMNQTGFNHTHSLPWCPDEDHSWHGLLWSWYPLHSDSLTFFLINPQGPWGRAAHLTGTPYYRGSVDLSWRNDGIWCGTPSVSCEYVLLPLVNKEAVFGQLLNRIELGRKLNWMPGQSRQGQGEAMYPLPETDMPEPCR